MHLCFDQKKGKKKMVKYLSIIQAQNVGKLDNCNSGLRNIQRINNLLHATT